MTTTEIAAVDEKAIVGLIEEKKAIEAYTAENGVEMIVGMIEQAARAFSLDVTTDAGRKEIASVAYKVARSKTLLEGKGTALTEEWRLKTADVNAKKKLIVTRLQALQDEIRQPLTDFENAEKARVDAHKKVIAYLTYLPTEARGMTIETLEFEIAELKSANYGAMQEFQATATTTRELVLPQLEAILAEKVKAEADRVELERLRAEKAQQEQREREIRLVAEAAALEKAKSEAAVLAAQKAQEEANERAKRAEADAQQRAIDAAAAERKRIADDAAAVAKADAARAADKAHRAKINTQILKAIEALGIDTETAKKLVITMCKGEIPNVTVNY